MKPNASVGGIRRSVRRACDYRETTELNPSRRSPTSSSLLRSSPEPQTKPMGAECHVCFETLTAEAEPSSLSCGMVALLLTPLTSSDGWVVSGHVCCSPCLAEWLVNHKECPVCTAPGESSGTTTVLLPADMGLVHSFPIRFPKHRQRYEYYVSLVETLQQDT